MAQFRVPNCDIQLHEPLEIKTIIDLCFKGTCLESAIINNFHQLN